MYGDSYRGYNICRFINREPCVGSHMQGTNDGDSYIGYNDWKIIWILQGLETDVKGPMHVDSYRS